MIAPYMPCKNRCGRPRVTAMRALVNSIFFIAQSGCQWRLLPKEFPPYTTVQRYFYRWRDDGTWQKINHHLVMMAREADGREASPTAGVIDSQSIKTTEAGGPRGFDAGKKIKGRKRHLLTDTAGFLIAGIVHEASVQDRDGAPALLQLIRSAFPGYVMSSPMVATPVRNSKRRLPQSAAGPSRSSNDPMPLKASNYCHAAGSSNEPSLGSTAIVVLQKTSRQRLRAPKHGS
jgi:transposase